MAVSDSAPRDYAGVMARLRGDASGRRLSDLDLMRAVQSGSPDAFEVLIARHLPAAQRLARAICHDDGRAEDAVQEALLSAWRRRATYRAQVGHPRPGCSASSTIARSTRGEASAATAPAAHRTMTSHASVLATMSARRSTPR